MRTNGFMCTIGREKKKTKKERKQKRKERVFFVFCRVGIIRIDTNTKSMVIGKLIPLTHFYEFRCQTQYKNCGIMMMSLICDTND